MSKTQKAGFSSEGTFKQLTGLLVPHTFLFYEISTFWADLGYNTLYSANPDTHEGEKLALDSSNANLCINTNPSKSSQWWQDENKLDLFIFQSCN